MNTSVYTISPHAIDLVAKITEKIGELKGSGEYSHNLRLRKISRLRSIQSSLAIENNTLTLNYSDIESAAYEISEADKKLDRDYYKIK